jgi:hypothetical protein
MNKKKYSLFGAVCLAASCLLTSGNLLATSYTYNGSGDWTETANWSPSYPGLILAASDSVYAQVGTTLTIPSGVAVNIDGYFFHDGYFDVVGTMNINNGGSVRCISMANTGTVAINMGGSMSVDYGTLDNNGTFNNAGALTIQLTASMMNSATFNNTGNLLINFQSAATNNAAGNFTNDGTLTNDNSFTNNGTLINNGIYKGNGMFNGSLFTNPSGGTVSPGGSPGCLTFSNDFTSTGTFQIDLNGATVCSQFDQINVAGTVTVGGTLSVNISGFAPMDGQTFQIANAATFVGSFSTVTVSPSNYAGTYSNGVLTIVLNIPEMDVQGNSVSIADGDLTPSLSDHTNFGLAAVSGGMVTRTFTILNTGSVALNLTGSPKVALSGTNATDFEVTVDPTSPVAATSGSTTFTVKFDPSGGGLRTATISISNDDTDENPYEFDISGEGGSTGNNALDFDGADDYVTVPFSTSLMGGTPTTIEFWGKIPAPAPTGFAFSINTADVAIRFANNAVQLEHFGGPAFNAGDINDGCWRHYAFTWDGTTAYGFIDGQPTPNPSASAAFPATGAGNLYIGAYNVQYFVDGTLDEVRIWNVQRTQAELQSNMFTELNGNEVGLVAYYKFNQGTAAGNNAGLTTLYDQTAGANNGTLNNFTLTGSSSNWVGSGALVQYPEANVKGNGISIADEDTTPSATDDTDFGSLATGGSVSHTFTIENTGAASLTVSDITSTNGQFAVGGISFPATITSGSSTTFTVTFNPSTAGLQVATINIASNDCSENPYNFNVQGTAINVQSSSLKLGGGGYLNAGAPPSLQFQPTGQWTVEFWVKPNDGAGGWWGIANDGASQLAGTGQWLIWGGNFHYYRDTEGGYLVTTPVSDGVWTHFATVYNNGTYTFYKNGVEVGTANQTYVTAIGWQLGAIWGNPPLDGYLDEFRIWNTARSQTDIQNNMSNELAGTEGGLAAYYKFDDSVNKGLDCTANSNYACEAFSPTFSTESPMVSDVACGGGGGKPEANLQGNGVSIVDGSATPSLADHTDFGTNTSRVFTIENIGTGALTVIDITLTGANATDFSVSGITLPATVAAGGSTTFTVNFTAGGGGIRTATVNIANSDCDENPYDFAIQAISLPGAALNFDGSNDFVNIPDAANLDLNFPLTLETWFRQTNNSGWRIMVDKRTANDVNLSYGLGALNGRPAFYTSNGAGGHIVHISPTAVSLNAWHHLTVTYDGSRVKIYVDGSLAYDQPETISITPTSESLKLGDRQQGGQPFVGDMDEVRLWNRVLCQDEIQTQMSCELTGSEAGLQAYYQFNDGTAGANNSGITTLTDLAGGDNDGTLNNFALSGSASNWAAPGGVTSGSSCTPFNQPEANVKGNGVTILDGDTTPSTTDDTDFGNQSVCSGAVVKTFTIENSGTANLSVSDITLSGGAAADFAVGGISFPANISAGGSTTFTATFNPSASGIRTATVNVANTDCSENPYNFSIQGTGVDPEINLQGNNNNILDGSTTPALTNHTDFGDALVTGGSVVRTFTIQNTTGTAALNMTGITLTGTNTADFTIGGITFPATIPAGSSTTFTVTFDPSALGTRTATVNIANNDCDETTYDFAIQGAGRDAAAGLNFDGTNDVVVLTDNLKNSLNNGTAITIEMWFKGTNAQSGFRFQDVSNAYIVSPWGAATPTHIISTDGGVGGGLPVGTGVLDGNWHHIAMTWQKNTVNGFKSYLDGVLVAQRNSANVNLPTVSQKPTLGGYFVPGASQEYMNGSLDEVRIWNVARSCEEINQLRNCELTGSEPGLLAYYKFNQNFASGNNAGATTLNDLAGTADNGTLTNFTLTGATSNWIAPGGVTTGTSCPGSIAFPEINVQGNGVSIADEDTTPSTTDDTNFSSQSVCSGAIVKTFTIENTGTSALSVSGITLTGTNAADFAVGGITFPASVAANGSTTFTVTFNPSALGVRLATLNMASNDCDEATYNFTIQGTGVDPEINLQGNNNNNILDGSTTPALTNHTDFGDALVTGGTVVRTFTIQNTTGTAPLSITGVSVTGTNAADFTVGGITFPATVAAGSSTTFTVTFDPSALGTRTATVNIANNDCDETTYDFAIQGAGRDPAAGLSFDGINDYVSLPNINPIGSGTAGQYTMETWVKLTNYTSGFGGWIYGDERNGNQGILFQIDASGHPWTFHPSVGIVTSSAVVPLNTWTHLALVQDASHTSLFVNGLFVQHLLTAPFLHLETGQSEYLGAFTTDNASFSRFLNGTLDEVRIWNYARSCEEINQLRNCELSGTEPGLLAYYKFNQNFAAGNNAGATTLTDLAGTADNGTLTNFALTGTTSNWIAPGGVTTGTSCPGSISFPEINVQGNGVSIADEDTTPSAGDDTDFGTTCVTGGAIVKTFTIQNTGASSLTLTTGGITLSGVNAADFAVSGITLPATVAAGGSTTFTVTFDPSSSGTRAATLNIGSSDCDENPYNFSIQGSGNDVTAGAVAGNQTICSGGDPAAFTAPTAATGTGTLTYQWQDSPDNSTFNDIGGAMAATYDPGALTASRFYRRIATSTLNGVACSDISNVLAVTVNDVTASVLASDQTICSGDDPAAFTAPTAATGTGALTYQWQDSPDNSTFNDISGATAATYDPGALTADRFFRQIISSMLNSVTCSTISNTVTVTVNNLTPGLVGNDQTVCPGGDPAAFVQTAAAAGDGALTYQWQDSPDNSTFTDIGGATGTAYDSPAVPATRYFRRKTISTLNSQACSDVSNVITVTAADNTPPTAVCQNITVQLDASGAATITASQINNGSTDNCGLGALSVSPSAFGCANVGGNTVTLTVPDMNGNSSTCTATVTVQDNVVPTAVCQNITVQLDAAGTATITASQVNNGSSDACGLGILSVSPNTFNCSNIGANSITLTVPDVNGNSSACTATVTIADQVAPTAVCQNVTVQLNAGGSTTITAAQVNNGSTDACGIASLSVSPSAFTCASVGAGGNTTTLTVTDVNGNSSTCTATVFIEDNVLPTALCQNATVQLDAAGSGTLTAASVNNNSADNCAIASMSVSPNTFSCANIGANTVTLTVFDVNNNSATCQATVTVEDQVAPTAICQNLTVQLDASGAATITASQINNGSSDVCGLGVLSVSPSSFSCANVGGNTVTLTVPDVNGNSSACTATVTIQDNLPPTAVCQNANVYVNTGGNATVTAALVDGGSSDNCALGTPDVSPAQFTCADLGNQTVTLTVPDVNGNSTACTATVTVLDTLAPVAICKNVSVQLGASGSVTVPATDVNDGSSDNCAIATFSLTPNTFTCANLGDNTVTLTVADASGNQTACAATVTVASDLVAEAGNDLTLCAGQGGQLNGSATGGSASYLFAWSPPDGLSATDLPDPLANPTGTITYTLTVTDTNGCTDTDEVTVTVEPSPTAVAASNSPVCQGGDLNLSETTGGAGAAWSWSGPNNFASSLQNPVIANATPAASGDYTVTVTAANGCTATATVAVNVYAAPIGDAGADVTICNGDTTQLQATGGSASVLNAYLWSPSATLSAANVANPLAFPTSTTTYTVTVSDANGCTDTDQVTVPVVPKPVINGVTAVCDANLLTYTVQLNTTGDVVTASAGTATDNGGGAWTISGIPTGVNITVAAVTSASGCETTLSVTAPNCNCPVVNAPAPVGPADIEICENEPIPALTVAVAAGETADWYDAPTGGTLLAQGSTNYTPIGGGSFYAETRIVVNSCLSAVRMHFTLTIHQKPEADAGAQATICAGAFAQLDGSGSSSVNGALTYLWSPAASLNDLAVVNPVATPAATTIYTLNVTDVEGCTDNDQVAVLVNLANPPSAGADQIACQGAVFPALTVSVGAGETADWYDAPTGGTLLAQGSASYSPSPALPAGTHVFYAETRLLAGGCTSLLRTPVTLTVNPAPSAVINGGAAVCEGNSVQLDATSSVGTAPLTFAWDNAPSLDDAAIPNPTASPLATTTYTVTVTDANGCTAIAASTVTVNANPLMDLGTLTCDPTFTNYSFPVTLTGGDQLGVSAPGASTGSGTSYTVTAPSDQDLTLKATNSLTGCFTERPVNGLDCNCATTLPPTSGGDPSICEGTPTPALTVTVAANETADWYDAPTGGTLLAQGSTTFNPSPTAAGTYIYYVETRSTANGCPSNSRTAISLTINALPAANAGIDATLCEGENNPLDGSGTGNGVLVFVWSPATGLSDPAIANPSASPASTTLYTLTVTDGNGCSSSDDLTLSVNPAPALMADAPVCTGLFYGLTLTTNADQVVASAGTVTGGSGLFTLSGVASLTDVTITATNSLTGCSKTLTITGPDCSCVGAVGAPLSGGDQQACPGATLPALTVTVNAGETAHWYDAATGGNLLASATVSFTPPGAGTFYAEAENPATGCKSDTRTAVSLALLTPPTAVITGDDAICDGETTTLTASGGTGFEWSTTETTPSIDVTPATTAPYSVTVTDANGCTDEESFNLTINPLPAVAIAGDDAICIGETTTLTASGGTVFLWNTNETAATISVTPAATGDFSVIVTDANGCSADASLAVTVHGLPNANAGVDVNFCEGTTGAALDASGSNGAAPLGFAWSPAATLSNASIANPLASPATDQAYQLIVTDANGCTSSDEVAVALRVKPLIEAASSSPVCTGEALEMFETGGQAAQWSWSGPGGFASTEQNPVLPNASVLAGAYSVIITDAFGCTNDATFDAAFSAGVDFEAKFLTGNTACAGDTIHFIEISETDLLPDAFGWDFGDGSTSTDRDPAHVYSDPGVYDISVVVTEGGCPNVSIVKTIEVLGGCRQNLENREFAFVNIYPVVNNGNFRLEVDMKLRQHLVVEIIDMKGVKLERRYFKDALHLKADFQTDTEGMYYVFLQTASGYLVRKVVIVK